MSVLFQRCSVFIHILERRLDQNDQGLKSHKQVKEKLLPVLWGIISFSSKIYSKWTLIRLECFFQPLPSTLFYPLLLLVYVEGYMLSQNPKSDAEVWVAFCLVGFWGLPVEVICVVWKVWFCSCPSRKLISYWPLNQSKHMLSKVKFWAWTLLPNSSHSLWLESEYSLT